MPQFTDAYEYEGRTLVDRDGEKVGKIDEVYTDREGGQPEWALVHTGLFGSKKHFVPLAGASPSGEDVRANVTKDAVKDAPSIDAGEELSEADERTLYQHYSISYSDEGSTTARGGTASSDASGTVGRDTSGPTTDDAMTRSEEELHVGTESRERGRVRLRKYVVTEMVTKTVPVSREEVRVEREPITDANRDSARSGPEISEEEHEVVLHEEQPIVEKRTVPKERVRLDTETVVDEQEVSEEIRKERIDVDDHARR
ncbi:PRC and DUF2382 domain-containing protein [Conexibacter stalactiti]|uniref:PRC and DUF2382 domain-containing protein n=1 Tax=Conexibacter stalactiti TaxID=1940611 RepID=A0ABU4HY19_9ACTN|nr:PRC and DUF2382 domain-containing protein [Conexibacter stalactiti]MDW5597764.1 PRC and DUF2382 domain-containing protein [Conexibacter stalactiti]MEC5038406.1 PRC and DUF2382 domain-containing protein [Conexibacter stalactiti]